MAVVRLLATCLFVLISAVAGAGVAAAAPTVTVTPSTGLAGGDVVAIQASGLEPDAPVRVVQCDLFNGDDELGDCPDLAQVTAGPTGQLAVTLTLADPVWRSQPFGDANPVYCRADICRIFLVWTDSQGTMQVLSSAPLEFEGSPATIVATPAADLRKSQKVTVTGTAVGAEGQTVDVVQEACFDIVQGSGCYGTRLLGSTTVAGDGSWTVRVRVQRFLPDGTDCASFDILGACQLTARILDGSGQPDDSFGVARIGQPGAALLFRA